jgi:uncharacterized protein (DUF433 family)
VRLRETLDAPSAKDAILRAVRIVDAIAQQTRRGGQLYVQSAEGQMQRLLIPELETPPQDAWQYLTARPHPWRRQLWVKGRKLPAAVVWTDWRVNGGTPEEIADNWDLPTDAVKEILRYGEENQEFLRMEAEEEKRRLAEMGISVTSRISG